MPEFCSFIYKFNSSSTSYFFLFPITPVFNESIINPHESLKNCDYRLDKHIPQPNTDTIPVEYISTFRSPRQVNHSQIKRNTFLNGKTAERHLIYYLFFASIN